MNTVSVAKEQLPRVHVSQPVVPHYRVPFFDALADRFGERLYVSASATHERGPSSAAVQRPYLELEHSCASLLGGRLLWQKGLRLRADFGPGDVAVVTGNPRYLSTFGFAYEARRRGVGLVIWSQLWSPTSTVLGAAIRTRLLQAADAVLTYTDYEAQQLRARLGTGVAVFGAQNAVDEQALQRARDAWSPEQLLEFQRSHALTDRHVLLFCGRLRSAPASGVDLLLSALALLLKQDPRYLAVIIGDGDDRGRLERVAAELGVASSVRWVGSQYDELANAPWFMSALCSVYPGAIGLSMMHALGYGAPVITHSDRLQHYPEFAALRPGLNGLVFAPGDAMDLARQVELLRSDASLRRAMSADAVRTVTEDFSLGNMVERFVLAVQAAQDRSLSRLRRGSGMKMYGSR
jgi:glycosyltransferase involved in cell wall biosynthesis